MNLSDSEREFLRKEEQRERSWLWLRWFALITSVLGVGVTAFCTRRLLDLMTDALAWFAPFVWLVLISMGGLLGWTLSQWQGDVKTQLLIRLIREHHPAGTQSDLAPNGNTATRLGNSAVTNEPTSASWSFGSNFVVKTAFILLSLAFAAACFGLRMVMRVFEMLHRTYPLPAHNGGHLTSGDFEMFCIQHASWLPFLAISVVVYAFFIASRGKTSVERFCLFGSLLAFALMILFFMVTLTCMIGWIPLYD